MATDVTLRLRLDDVYRPAMATDSGSQFERETLQLIAALRDDLRMLVGTLEGDPTTGADLQRQLGLDMKLCWKLSRVLTAADSLAAAAFIPGRANMRDLLTEFARRDAPAELVERARNHAESFEGLIRRHAGDRRTFDSMVSQWRGEETEKVDLEQRRAAFRANSHLWGVQADVGFCTQIMQRSAREPDMMDGVVLTGELGLRRLRRIPTAMFTKSIRIADYDGVVRREPRIVPLDETGPGDVPFSLLRPFCSEELPDLRIERHGDGSLTVSLQQDAIGRAGSVDVVTGWVQRSFDTVVRPVEELPNVYQFRMASPWKAAVYDHFIAEGVLDGAAARSAIYADRVAAASAEAACGEVNLLCRDAGGGWLGQGLAAASTPLMRRYKEMLRHVFSRAQEILGGSDEAWNPERFRLFRTVVEYPVMFSRIVVSIGPEARDG